MKLMNKKQLICKNCGSNLISAATQKGKLVMNCPNDDCIEKSYIQRMKNNPNNILSLKGVYGDYLNCTLDNFKCDDSLKRLCQEFIDKPSYGIYFTGGVGCGKTHLATAITRKFAQKGVKNFYYKAALDILLPIFWLSMIWV